jgi:hypothetical protein
VVILVIAQCSAGALNVQNAVAYSNHVAVNYRELASVLFFHEGWDLGMNSAD